MSIILASASPRRRELLALITEDFKVVVSDVDETLPDGIPPDEAVRLLALRKAREVAKDFSEETVIGSDTVVAAGGEILGKPADAADAERMLGLLSGREHSVYTGVAVISGGREEVFFEAAKVFFAPLSQSEIREYIQDGEYKDKAGGYAIQGRAARFIERIEGDYAAVVGLPVHRLYKALRDMGAL